MGKSTHRPGRPPPPGAGGPSRWVCGSGRIKLDAKVAELKVFDVGGSRRTWSGLSRPAGGLEIIAVGGRKPEEGDGVLDKGRWPAE
jgi:hypothetical protein